MQTIFQIVKKIHTPLTVERAKGDNLSYLVKVINLVMCYWKFIQIINCIHSLMKIFLFPITAELEADFGNYDRYKS